MQLHGLCSSSRWNLRKEILHGLGKRPKGGLPVGNNLFVLFPVGVSYKRVNLCSAKNLNSRPATPTFTFTNFLNTGIFVSFFPF